VLSLSNLREFEKWAGEKKRIYINKIAVYS
jgi:hypothetical protein